MSISRVYSMPFAMTESIELSFSDSRATLSLARTIFVSVARISTLAVPFSATSPSTPSSEILTLMLFSAPLSAVA